MILGKLVAISCGTSIRTFFFVATQTGILLFKEIDGEIKNGFNIDSEEQKNESELERWRVCYNTVCRFIDHVNESFGLFLLLNIIWIFFTSLHTFCVMLLSYTFIVVISLRFNLKEMFLSVYLTEINFKSLKYGKYDAKYDFHVTQELHTFRHLEAGCYSTLFHSSLLFAIVWIRFLIILLPSYLMQNQVRRNSLTIYF